MGRPKGARNKIPRLTKFTDSELAIQVRTLTLEKIRTILMVEPSDNGELAFQRAVILSLARNVLPKINEIRPVSDTGFSFQVVSYVQNKPLNGSESPAIESKMGELTPTTLKEAEKVQHDARALSYATGVVLDATTDDEQ